MHKIKGVFQKSRHCKKKLYLKKLITLGQKICSEVDVFFPLRKSMKEQVDAVRSKRENSSEEKQKPICRKKIYIDLYGPFFGDRFS